MGIKLVAIITLCIVLLLVNFVYAYAYHEYLVTSQFHSAFNCSKKYTNQQYSFSVICPKGWVYAEDPFAPPIEGKVVAFSPSIDDYHYQNTFVVISVLEGQANDILPNTESKEVVEQTILRYFEKDHRYEFEESWSKWIKIDDYDAHKIKFSWLDWQAGWIQVISTLLFVGDDVWIVSGYSVDANYQLHLEKILSIINSFEISAVQPTIIKQDDSGELPKLDNEGEEFVIENDCEVDSDAILNYILTHDAENFEAWYQRGIIEYDCDRYGSASFYFSAALGLDPDHEQAQKYKELSEQKYQEERQAQETESANIELILLIGVGGGTMGLIIWYYDRKKKK